MTAKGPIDALGLSVTADAPSMADGPAKLIAAGTLNATDKTLALNQMEASWKQQALRLLAPAKLNFVDGVAMDRLRLGFRQAELTVSGKAGSTLDLTATLRNLPADIGAIANPAFAADGVIAADVRLTAHPLVRKALLNSSRPACGNGKGPLRRSPRTFSPMPPSSAPPRIDTKLTAGPVTST